MSAVQEVQKRNNKAQHLRVLQAGEADYFVESEEGKICYKVSYLDGKQVCSCGDYSKNSKADPQFMCKHILAIANSEHDFEKAKFLERVKPKLDERFIIKVDGQEFVKYAGLLDLSHQRRLTSLEVEILQYPTKENDHTAISRARIQTLTGEVFTDVGDANLINCNSKVSKHLVRMSSTRAKARVMRDLNNIGMTCMEELGDVDDVLSNEEKGTAQKGKLKPFPRKIVSGPNNGNGKGTVSADTVKNVSPVAGPKSEEVEEPGKELQKDEKKTTADSKPEAKASEKPGPNGKGKVKVDIPPKMSEAQHRAIMNLSRRRGISVEELEKMSNDIHGIPLEKLSPSDASSFIRQLQQSA